MRQLEREIGRVMRHAAMRIANDDRLQVHVDAADLDTILGPEKFEHEVGLRTSLPGRGHWSGMDASGRRHSVH